MFAAREVESPIGTVGVEASDAGVCRVWLPGSAPLGFGPHAGSDDAERILDTAVAQLHEFFDGERERFDVPLDWSQASDGFGGKVQRALVDIPYGETYSYGELADRLGRPRAARAVGTACSHNPLPLFAGCHRVIRANGDVGLYGGGERMKRQLLDLEVREA